MRSIKITKGNRVGESALFHEFGRCDNGSEAETCAIVEHRDGTVTFLPVPYIQFVPSEGTEQKGSPLKILDLLKDICLQYMKREEPGNEGFYTDAIIDAYGYLDKAGLI